MKGRKFIWVRVAAAACFTLLATTACASAPRAPTDAEIEAQYRSIDGGVLIDEGVRIDAEDGSFSITEGRFATPFQMRMAPLRWTPIFSPLDFDNRRHSTPLISAWSGALARGAVRVRVTIPGVDEPLYGVIQFNKAHQSAVGAASRAYRITIPQQYIELASDAKVSVVYETMERPDGRLAYGWLLWLSDFPAFQLE